MKKFYFLFLFILPAVSSCLSQDTANYIFHLDSIPAEAILLDTGWKFHGGDNAGWASPGYDDKNWEYVNPTLELYFLPQIQKQPIGWFRIHLHVAPALL